MCAPVERPACYEAGASQNMTDLAAVLLQACGMSQQREPVLAVRVISIICGRSVDLGSECPDVTIASWSSVRSIPLLKRVRAAPMTKQCAQAGSEGTMIMREL